MYMCILTCKCLIKLCLNHPTYLAPFISQIIVTFYFLLLFEIVNFPLILTDTTNTHTQTFTWRTYGSILERWLRNGPGQFCKVERFRVQAGRPDSGQSTSCTPTATPLKWSRPGSIGPLECPGKCCQWNWCWGGRCGCWLWNWLSAVWKGNQGGIECSGRILLQHKGYQVVP